MSKQAKVKAGTSASRADNRVSVAIVKEVGDRRFFFGRERNKRSRKYNQKNFSKVPINLNDLVKEISLKPVTSANK